MASADGFNDVQVNDLVNYRNQADYLLHGLLHTDLAAKSIAGFPVRNPIPHISDVQIPLRTALLPMYELRWTKTLANYGDPPVDNDLYNNAGFYTQRNGMPSATLTSRTTTSLLMCFCS